MIKAVVFDLDGVIYFEGRPQTLVKKYGIPYKEVSGFFHNEFQKCVKGKADLKREIRKYLKEWKWKGGTEKLFDAWFNRGNANADAMKFVSELKRRGIACILCTNNEKYRADYLARKFSLGNIFDCIIASHEIGVKKPGRIIFDRIVETTGLKPSEIAFVDDKKSHAVAATKYGMKGIVFSSLDKLKKELNNL